MKDKTITTILFSFIVIFFLFIVGVAEAGNTIIPYNSQVQKNGVAHNGNASFYIYNLATSGTELYHESFNDSISQGLLQVMLGYQNESLALTAGNWYWMDVSIDGIDTNATINGTNSDRIPFVAPVSAYQPLNISKLIVNGGDTDDAVNVSGGFFQTGKMIIANFFNITVTDSKLTTNGSILFTGKQANCLSINGFNFSCGTDAAKTNGTLTITNADTDDALNVSAGGAYVKGNLKVDGSITGAGGLAGDTDVPWELVSWQNFSSTRGWINISVPSGNAFRLDFLLFSENKRCDNDAFIDELSGIGLIFNNGTTNKYVSSLKTATAISVESSTNATIVQFATAGGFGNSRPVMGSLYIYQMGANSGIVYNADIATVGNATKVLSHGISTINNKISEVNFVGHSVVTGCLAQNTLDGRINGTVKLYVNKEFKDY